MKKLLLSLSILSLAGALYAGSACCSEKSADKTEKKAACAKCEKVEGKCAVCAAKAKEKIEVKTDSKS